MRSRKLAQLTFVFLLLVASSPIVLAAGFPGEQPTYARETGFVQRFYYVASGDGVGQIQYLCKCFPGTTGCGTTSTAVWQVQRFTYDSSNRISTITYAAGDDAYTSICDNRTTLDYVD